MIEGCGGCWFSIFHALVRQGAGAARRWRGKALARRVLTVKIETQLNNRINLNTMSAKKAAETCPICADTYTGTLRKEVCCAFCSFTSCNVCTKKYLCDGVLDPHCMSCRRAWTDEFLDANFSRAWRTGLYKKHREDILVEREMAILPTRQARVEAFSKRKETETAMATLSKQIRELETQITALNRQQGVQSAWYHRYNAEFMGQTVPAWTMAYTHPQGGGAVEKKERAQFIMKCPDEGCRGFLSSAYKCGTCANWFCSDCLVKKGEDKDAPHTCDEKLKETVALIIKESKPCPKCGQRISKIDGCDQMWCTECHTAFSWTTGKVVNGVVHNPHYYEFLRQQGGGAAPRVAGDLPCGGVPYYHVLMTNMRGLPASIINEVSEAHRTISEVNDQRVGQYQGAFTQEDNGDLGVRYLLREITKEEMKKELAKRESKRNKQMAIRAILEMFALTGAEMLQRFTRDPKLTLTQAQEVVTELRALRDYANDSLYKISQVKGVSVPQIGMRREQAAGGTTAAVESFRQFWRWIQFFKAPPLKKRAPAEKKKKAAAAGAGGGAVGTTANDTTSVVELSDDDSEI